MTDQLRQAAQDVVSAFSAALTEMESSLGDMVRESNCEGGTQFDTVRGYKALWAAQVELENLRAALAAQPADQWREAVEEQFIINYTDMPEDPREAIKKLIATEVEMALDPTISSAAAALAQAGGAMTAAPKERSAI